MRLEWDEAKRQSNLTKHGLDFADAAAFFAADPDVYPDSRRDYGEERFIAVGRLAGRLLVVAFTLRGEGIRVISMRKANAREEARHGEE